MKKYDAIVIGAGHNGITNAAREILAAMCKPNTVPQGWPDD
jgi:tRNA U34 5-carboxymethylaminomethyl modifying enzyme MnmG/GidA